MSSPWVIWAFVFEKKDLVFSEENLGVLPCRLGLREMTIKEYLPLELAPPPDSKTKKATAFDAELNDFWCPGGKTCPRIECAENEGLHEVVIADKDNSPGNLSMWKIANSPTYE